MNMRCDGMSRQIAASHSAYVYEGTPRLNLRQIGFWFAAFCPCLVCTSKRTRQDLWNKGNNVSVVYTGKNKERISDFLFIILLVSKGMSSEGSY